MKNFDELTEHERIAIHDEDHAAAYRSGYAHGMNNSFLPCPYVTGSALFSAWIQGYKDGISKRRHNP